jgi:hypothetical protein
LADLILEMHIREHLTVGVADAEAFGRLVNGPRRREAAGGSIMVTGFMDPRFMQG